MMTFMVTVLSRDRRQSDILDPPQIAGIELDQKSRYDPVLAADGAGWSRFLGAGERWSGTVSGIELTFTAAR
jgi:hypothetical protein